MGEKLKALTGDTLIPIGLAVGALITMAGLAYSAGVTKTALAVDVELLKSHVQKQEVRIDDICKTFNEMKITLTEINGRLGNIEKKIGN